MGKPKPTAALRASAQDDAVRNVHGRRTQLIGIILTVLLAITLLPATGLQRASADEPVERPETSGGDVALESASGGASGDDTMQAPVAQQREDGMQVADGLVYTVADGGLALVGFDLAEGAEAPKKVVVPEAVSVDGKDTPVVAVDIAEGNVIESVVALALPQSLRSIDVASLAPAFPGLLSVEVAPTQGASLPAAAGAAAMRAAYSSFGGALLGQATVEVEREDGSVEPVQCRELLWAPPAMVVARVPVDCLSIAPGALADARSLETIVCFGDVQRIATAERDEAGNVTAEGALTDDQLASVTVVFPDATPAVPSEGDGRVSASMALNDGATQTDKRHAWIALGLPLERLSMGKPVGALTETVAVNDDGTISKTDLQLVSYPGMHPQATDVKHPDESGGIDMADSGLAFTMKSDMTLSVRWEGDPTAMPPHLGIPAYVAIDDVTYPVTEITPNAFSDASLLGNIAVPEGVEVEEGYVSAVSSLSGLNALVDEGVSPYSAEDRVFEYTWDVYIDGVFLRSETGTTQYGPTANLASCSFNAVEPYEHWTYGRVYKASFKVSVPNSSMDGSQAGAYYIPDIGPARYDFVSYTMVSTAAYSPRCRIYFKTKNSTVRVHFGLAESDDREITAPVGEVVSVDVSTLGNPQYSLVGLSMAAGSETADLALLTEGQSSLSLDMPEVDSDYYAVWAPTNLAADYGGGQKSQTDTTASEALPRRSENSTTSTFDLPTPYRAGYVFTGWEASSGVTVSADNKTATTTEANQSVTATWKLDEVTVSFDANGGSGASTSDQKVKPGTPVALPTGLVRDGFELRGWALPGSDVSGGQNVLAGTYAPNASVTLTAVWEPVKHSVSYDVSAAPGGGVAKPADAAFVGRSIVGQLYSGPDGSGAYALKGGLTGIVTAGLGQTMSYALPVPSVAGYAFEGWSANGKSGIWDFDDIDFGGSRSVTLAGSWAARERMTVILGADGPELPGGASDGERVLFAGTSEAATPQRQLSYWPERGIANDQGEVASAGSSLVDMGFRLRSLERKGYAFKGWGEGASVYVSPELALTEAGAAKVAAWNASSEWSDAEWAPIWEEGYYDVAFRIERQGVVDENSLPSSWRDRASYWEYRVEHVKYLETVSIPSYTLVAGITAGGWYAGALEEGSSKPVLSGKAVVPAGESVLTVTGGAELWLSAGVTQLQVTAPMGVFLAGGSPYVVGQDKRSYLEREASFTVTGTGDVSVERVDVVEYEGGAAVDQSSGRPIDGKDGTVSDGSGLASRILATTSDDRSPFWIAPADTVDDAEMADVGDATARRYFGWAPGATTALGADDLAAFRLTREAGGLDHAEAGAFHTEYRFFYGLDLTKASFDATAIRALVNETEGWEFYDGLGTAANYAHKVPLVKLMFTFKAADAEDASVAVA